MFLEFFQLQGEEYLKRINQIPLLTKASVDRIMLDVNETANEMESRYKPLKSAIFKEQGEKELTKVTP